MKKCMHCGTIQDNKYIYCIDCNAKLGDPLSKEEEANLTSKGHLSFDYNNCSTDNTDYFKVSKLDKAKAIILFIFAVLHFLLIMIKADFLRERGTSMLGLFAMIYAIIEALDILLPDISWELYKFKFRYSIRNSDYMEPSDYYLTSRKIFSWLSLIAVIVVYFFLLIDIIAFSFK